MPYSLPAKTPTELRKVWRKRLINAPLIYQLSFLTTKLLHPFLFYFAFYQQRKAPFYKKIKVLTLKDKIHPTYYAYFHFSDLKQWAKRYDFLYHRSMQHCLWHLSQRTNAIILQDKYLFYQFCWKHHLPTVQNFAYYEHEKAHWLSPKPWQQQEDFIIKARKASKGKGFVCFQYIEAKQAYRSSKNQVFISTKELENYIQQQIGKDTYLLQECLNNHAQFLKLGNNAPAILRVLSLADKNGRIHLFRPILKVPQGESLLSYVHEGALAIAIDVETGQFLDALEWTNQTAKDISALKGVKIPFWQQIEEMLLIAHQQLSPLALIGWDIAITPKGPILLEGNLSPNLDIHQKPPFTPFIGSVFYDLLLDQLKKEEMQ